MADQILIVDDTAVPMVIKCRQDINTAVPDAMPTATTTVQGKVELATHPESVAGTDTARAVTPAGMEAWGAEHLYVDARYSGMAVINNVNVPAGVGLFAPSTYATWTELYDAGANFDAANGNLIVPDWADQAIVTANMLLHATSDNDMSPVMYLAIDNNHTDDWAANATGPLVQSGVNGLNVNGFYTSLSANLLIPDKQNVWGTSLTSVRPIIALGGSSITAIIDKLHISWEFVRYTDTFDNGGGQI